MREGHPDQWCIWDAEFVVGVHFLNRWMWFMLQDAEVCAWLLPSRCPLYTSSHVSRNCLQTFPNSPRGNPGHSGCSTHMQVCMSRYKLPKSGTESVRSEHQSEDQRRAVFCEGTAFPSHPWSQSCSFQSTAQSKSRQLWTWRRSACHTDVTGYSCSTPYPEFHLPRNAEQFPGSNVYSVCITAALASVCWEGKCLEDGDNWRSWVSPSVLWIPGHGLMSSGMAATAFRCWAFPHSPLSGFSSTSCMNTKFKWNLFSLVFSVILP